MHQTTLSVSDTALGGSAVPEAERPASASADPDPGYVYLSVSRAMPGFVQVASSPDDPRGLTWTLQTTGGVTRFRTVCAVRTSNCAGLAERFRQAVLFDQIPHHADLFKIPLRFARNILEGEAVSLPAATPAPPPDRRKSIARLAVCVLGLALPLALLALHSSPTPAPAAAQPVRSAPATPPPVAKPQFRISKM